MKVSLIQTNPGTDRPLNLKRAGELMQRALDYDRPDLIVLPEYFDYYGGNSQDKMAAMQTAPDGDSYRFAQDFAKKNGVFVHAGSIGVKIEGEDRVHNTTFVFNREGKEVAVYRKIHLFDVTTQEGTQYHESKTVKPGEDIATYEIDGFKVGCAICYDIRFASLFLALEKAGADVIVLPAAFTLQTGKDHWEVLARARAIETQTYFVACGQTGAYVSDGETRFTYGHSLVCDPWGMIVASASDGEGFVSAHIERERITRARTMIPTATHRRFPC